MANSRRARLEALRDCYVEIKKNEYTIMIQWSDEDGEFIARVEQLPGVTASGETLAEAATELEDALAAYHASQDSDIGEQ